MYTIVTAVSTVYSVNKEKLNINLCQFGVGLDEGLSRRNFGAHQDVKYFICLFGIVDVYFFEHPVARVHGGFLQLFRIHFS